MLFGKVFDTTAFHASGVRSCGPNIERMALSAFTSPRHGPPASEAPMLKFARNTDHEVDRHCRTSRYAIDEHALWIHLPILLGEVDHAHDGTGLALMTIRILAPEPIETVRDIVRSTLFRTKEDKSPLVCEFDPAGQCHQFFRVLRTTVKATTNGKGSEARSSCCGT